MKTTSLAMYSATGKWMLLVACLTTFFFASAQEYKFVEGDISVHGLSNVREWQMSGEIATCNADLDFAGSKLIRINSIQFSINVKDLKGDAALMNKRAHNALKAYPYDRISFIGKFIDISDAGEGKYAVKTKGNLNIAGITHVVMIPVTVSVIPDGTIICTGSKNLKMSDYKVRLPEVLVRNMEISDDVTVNFKLHMRH